jgi:hypothetical protein
MIKTCDMLSNESNEDKKKFNSLNIITNVFKHYKILFFRLFKHIFP